MRGMGACRLLLPIIKMPVPHVLGPVRYGQLYNAIQVVTASRAGS